MGKIFDAWFKDEWVMWIWIGVIVGVVAVFVVLVFIAGPPPIVKRIDAVATKVGQEIDEWVKPVAPLPWTHDEWDIETCRVDDKVFKHLQRLNAGECVELCMELQEGE